MQLLCIDMARLFIDNMQLYQLYCQYGAVTSIFLMWQPLILHQSRVKAPFKF